MLASCFDMEASAEEIKAEVPANPETKEASEVKAEVAEEAKEAAEAGHVINLWSKISAIWQVRSFAVFQVCLHMSRQ